MRSRDDIQAWLEQIDGGVHAAQEVESGLWLVKTPDGAEIVVNYAPPVVLLRVRIMEPPGDVDRRSGLFRQLLEFNARDLVHGSYGLEGEQVVLTDTLELENLDYAEFQASFDSINLALASHLTALAPFRER